ncbi:MAG: protein phosphatase 2C domain-containing protein [Myxococcales bacterium]|nr:protein phosphatase 2C domain-containing protein [Myxococcales bacterium]
MTRAQGVDGVPQWRVVGASVRGSGHEQSGAECQDAHAVDVTLGMMVVAVADGAGSARYAALGSAAAASAALDSVRAERALGLPQTESAWRDCLARVLDGARERLVQEAREHGAELRIATTSSCCLHPWHLWLQFLSASCAPPWMCIPTRSSSLGRAARSLSSLHGIFDVHRSTSCAFGPLAAANSIP